ncbi:MAG: DUF3300 domain-containing protein [Betaproteobacteria bacterium]
MTTLLRKFAAALLSVLFLAPGLASAQRVFSQPELDRLLAPVALYPDPLLSQVLMAATYPADVAGAARWSRFYSHLSGDEAVRAATGQDWDPSVVSLLAFPQLLQRMDENPEWTRTLGEAFLAQEPHVMDTVQQLRRRAQAAGHLRSDDRILVQPQGQTLVIAPAQPQVVYLPYYDPLVVYGPWWWPSLQPVYWSPWPGYARVHRPGASVSFWWGAPVRLSLGFFFGGVDWYHRQVRVVHVHNHYVHSHRHVHLAPGHWRRDDHRERVVERRVIERPVIERPVIERRVLERPAVERRIVERTAIERQVEAPRVREPRREPVRVQVQPIAAPQAAAPGVQEPRREPARVQAPRRDPRNEARNERPRRGGDRS